MCVQNTQACAGKAATLEKIHYIKNEGTDFKQYYELNFKRFGIE